MSSKADCWMRLAPSIRFFVREGQPEYPYCALGDLIAALNFPEGALPVLIKLIAPSEGHEMLVVDTPDGPTTCASFLLAKFLIEDSIAFSAAPPSALGDFDRLVLDYLIAKQCAGLEHDEARAFMAEAHANSVERAMKPRLAN